VSSLGYCDQNPEGLGGAEIIIENNAGITTTITSKSDGSYQRWLDSLEGPYHITIQAADHIQTSTDDFQIPAGGTVEQDFELRWLKACVDVEPDSLEVQLPLGVSTTVPITLSNSGPVSTPFDFGEIDLGSSRLEIQLQPVILNKPSVGIPSDSKTAPTLLGRMSPAYLTKVDDILLDEGFEGGLVPPDEWTQVINNLNTWEVDSTAPHSGSYLARVAYDFDQDEWLLSPELQISEGTLSFWSFGSLYWCRDTYDNCDLNIWLVVGDVGGEDDIFVGKPDDDWTTSWTWTQSVFELDDKLPGRPVRIGFQYSGDDGAEIGLDDINLDGGGGIDIPWVSVEPKNGTIVAESNSLQVNVVFEANQPQPYHLMELKGNLILNTEDPVNGEIQIPVSMTIESHVTYLLLVQNGWRWGP
jgi:hypothetical protein